MKINSKNIRALHAEQSLAEREQDLAVLLNHSLPLSVVLTDHEFEIELQRL